MNIKNILEITKGTLINKIDLSKNINKFKINSKLIEKNDVYIAIVGPNKNGHNFIKEAIKNGAGAIIISQKGVYNVPTILVKDTTKTLGLITTYLREKYNPKIIAITGSVGKTTTRELITTILKTQYTVLQNEKNYNNNIGVPLTIFNLNHQDFAVIEMGMNHLTEISYLSKIIKPNIGVITKIGTSHLGNLGSKENILKAKLEIIDGMEKKLLFVNGDDELLKNISIPKITSGFNSNNNLKAYNLKTNLYTSSFNIDYKDKTYLIKINLPKHLINNVLIAINIGLYYNIKIDTIINALKNYQPFQNRMNIINNETNTIINDCYNSSFESLTGVLDIIKTEPQKKLLILGDINELGKFSQEIHQKLKVYLDQIKNKEVILIGKEMQKLKYNALYFPNYQETINYLKTQKIKNTLILIKASRNLKLENITNFLLKNTLNN